MPDRLHRLQRLLFLCTGNYYRSRFAEILFNALIFDRSINWVADSRGIATELGVNNIGPLSKYTRLGLHSRGIALPTPLRFPQQLKREELESADRIVALKEAEHRPLLDERFPTHRAHIEYWRIDDLDQAPAHSALAAIELEVRNLILRLTTDTCT